MERPEKIEPKNLAEKRFEESLLIPLTIVAILWAIHLFQIALQYFLNYDLATLGIYPLKLSGLKGIFFAPLIHSGFRHLFSNSIPTLMLGIVIYYFYKSIATKSLTMIYLLTGLAVWLFARSVYHIGISGVVYGMIAFITFMGIFRRNIKSIVLALAVTVLYSGSFFTGVLPNQVGISWESHLFGAFAGIFTAYFYKGELEEDEHEENPFAYEPERSERPLFSSRRYF